MISVLKKRKEYNNPDLYETLCGFCTNLYSLLNSLDDDRDETEDSLILAHITGKEEGIKEVLTELDKILG